jgi:hypothetical protein
MVHGPEASEVVHEPVDDRAIRRGVDDEPFPGQRG